MYQERATSGLTYLRDSVNEVNYFQLQAIKLNVIGRLVCSLTFFFLRKDPEARVGKRRAFKAWVRPPQLPPPIFLGSLSNDNSDFNENGKNPIGLDWQNNNFVRASRFLYIS